MSKDSGERKSGDQSKKGKGILIYQRKKSRKDGHNNKAADLPSKQHAPPPPPESPEVTVTDWADANSGHLLTCACRVCTGGAVPTPLFRSNVIASPQLADSPLHNLPMPVFQFGRFKPHRPERDCLAGFVPQPQRVLARFRTKVSKAKVYPSIVIPPSNENQKTCREISLPLPKMEDISFIELLASGDEKAPSQPAISFTDMLQNEKLKGDHQALVPGKKVAGGCNLRQCFVEESNGLPPAGEPKSRLNYFMKMVMEEEGGVDDEQLFREVKQELMIREVDAYACLLRKQNLDFGRLMTTN